MNRSIEVVSYNLRHGTDETDCESLGAQAEVLASADVALLQELDCATDRSHGRHQLDELAALAGFPYAHFAANLEYQHGWYGTGILSRHPILDTVNLPVPKVASGETIEIDGKVRTVPEPRGVLLATLDVDGRQLLIGVHHASLWTTERLAGLAMLAAAGMGFPGAVILGGDLNTGDVEQLTVLREHFDWYSDTERTPATYPSSHPSQHIDHLFGRGLTHLATEVGDVLCSDHRPLKTRLAFQNTALEPGMAFRRQRTQ